MVFSPLLLPSPQSRGEAGMHSTAMEPQEAALFLPLNHGDLMASLKDHKSGLPNCYPSSTFALSTLTFCHISLENLNPSSIRNLILLLCFRASLT